MVFADLRATRLSTKSHGDQPPVRYHVHFMASGSARSGAGSLAQPLFALRNEVAATLVRLEERKRWKPFATPSALIAHANQMVHLLEEALVERGATSRQAPETLELRRRLMLVQALFAPSVAAAGAMCGPRSLAAPEAPGETP